MEKKMPIFQEVINEQEINQNNENKEELNKENAENVIQNKEEKIHKYRQIEKPVIYNNYDKNTLLINAKYEAISQQHKELHTDFQNFKKYILNENKSIIENTIKEIIDKTNKEIDSKLSSIVNQINNSNNLMSNNNIIPEILNILLKISKYLELYVWKFKLIDIEINSTQYDNKDTIEIEKIFNEKLNNTMFQEDSKLENIILNLNNLINNLGK